MSPLLRIALFVVLLVIAPLRAATTAPTVKAEDLPRIPPTEPKEAVKTFRVRPGFHIELAASEPNIVDPIAMSFDENGRLFVVEMRDYSERRAEKLGRIRMLEDRDGDGVYETSTIFLDHLPWPTAVMCVNGGVLIGACPDIIFAKDTNGDGVADEVKTVFTGFGSTQQKLNVQGLFNNFIWGLDNRIHGCSGGDGGMVTQALHPDKPPLDVHEKGFVIDPRDWSMTTEAGGGQYGLSFDQTGRLFTCSNSSHCEAFMYDSRLGARNPYATLPDPRISIAADGPAAEVYRISPEEPWRVIRTRWRIAGLVGGPVEGGGRSAGYFTGATGLTIYRGDAFGPDYVGDGFVGDAGGNLVHHKRIRPGPDGISLIAKRPDDEMKSEFAASTDTWFRPVDFANAPDGTLYIADMYREVIEHPWSIPPEIKKYLDLNSGNDRGRIYRLAPDGFVHRPPPRLSEATAAELVKTLENPNGWHRETASRLLFERQDKSEVPLLRNLLRTSTSALARMHALHLLDGLTALYEADEADVIAGLRDSDPIVREHAVMLADRFLASPRLSQSLARLADDPAPLVRYQLAFHFISQHKADSVKVLATLARRDGSSEWMRTAILCSCADFAPELFAALADDRSPLREQLAQMIGSKGDRKEISGTVAVITQLSDVNQRIVFAGALARGAGDKVREPLKSISDEAAKIGADSTAPAKDRVSAIGLLGMTGRVDALAALLAEPHESIQLAVLAAFEHADAPNLMPALVADWQKFSPRVQTEAASLLIKRPDRAKALLDAIAAKELPSSALSTAQAAFLRRHPDAAVKEMAMKILPPPPSRDSVIAGFRPALDLSGDAAKGHAIYAQRCISCHIANGEGSRVGPDFTTVKNGGKEKLMTAILDPNREVAATYVAYLVETKDGQSVLGIIASDLPTTIALRQAYGKETQFPRSQIRHMTSEGKSLMPEGLEEKLSQQDLADLISFIESVSH